MRFGFTADLHFSSYGSGISSDDRHISKTLLSIKNSFIYMIEYCIKKDIKTIIIGGDVLHNKSLVHSVAFNSLLSVFERFPDVDFIILDGNHDKTGKGKSAESSLRGFKNISNITLFENDSVFLTKDVFIVPFSGDMIQDIKNNEAKFLITHLGLNEGVLDSGISIISDLKFSDVSSNYKYTLAGHYHCPQIIKNEFSKFFYTGSLCQLDWKEKNQEKRFLLVDADNERIESIPSDGYRKFIEIILKEEDDDIKEKIKFINEQKNNGHEVKALNYLPDDILKELDESVIVVDKKEEKYITRGVSSSMSDEEKLLRYLDIKEIPDEEKEEYLNIAREIVNMEGEK